MIQFLNLNNLLTLNKRCYNFLFNIKLSLQNYAYLTLWQPSKTLEQRLNNVKLTLMSLMGCFC